jgi:hypothetical protein
VDSGLKFLEDYTVGDEVRFAFEPSESVAFEKTTAQNLVVTEFLTCCNFSAKADQLEVLQLAAELLG